MEEVKAIKPKAGDASPTHANLGGHHSSIIALVQLLARHAAEADYRNAVGAGGGGAREADARRRGRRKSR